MWAIYEASVPESGISITAAKEQAGLRRCQRPEVVEVVKLVFRCGKHIEIKVYRMHATDLQHAPINEIYAPPHRIEEWLCSVLFFRLAKQSIVQPAIPYRFTLQSGRHNHDKNNNKKPLSFSLSLRLIDLLQGTFAGTVAVVLGRHWSSTGWLVFNWSWKGFFFNHLFHSIRCLSFSCCILQ